MKVGREGIGSFTIIGKVNDNAYILDLPPELEIPTTVNVEDLTCYEEPLSIQEPEINCELEIEAILKDQNRLTHDKVQLYY